MRRYVLESDTGKRITLSVYNHADRFQKLLHRHGVRTQLTVVGAGHGSGSVPNLGHNHVHISTGN
jgi:hypothetical protein